MDLTAAVEAAKSRSAEARPREFVDLPLPLYGGAFAARFGLLPDEDRERFQKRAEDDKITLDQFNAEFVAASCRQMLKVEEGRGELLTHSDGRPVRFDADFAEALDLELDDQSASAVVRAVFSLRNGEFNPGALNIFSEKVGNWANDTSMKLDGELLGESVGILR